MSGNDVNSGSERAIHGLLQEWARCDSGVDEAFVQRVMSGLESGTGQRASRRMVRRHPRRRWWPLALAAGLLITVSLALLAERDQALRPLVRSGSLTLQRAGEQHQITAGARLSMGDALTAMPLFLKPGRYVPAPLEESYARTFRGMPRRYRDVLERPA